MTVNNENSLAHPYLRQGLEPRIFQQTILNTCIRKNTLVVLPTGAGKTIIAVLHIAYLIQNEAFSNDDFVLFLTPTKALVQQHSQTFKKFLNIPARNIIQLSGSINPDKREKLAHKAKIIIATPQTIRNDIINDQINLQYCPLVYFDEAHRATGNYAYVPIAEYLSKIQPNARIVALTASPGTTKDEILTLCKNLQIEKVECRSASDPELKRYMPETVITQKEVPLPIEFEELLTTVKAIGERECERLQMEGVLEKPFEYLYKGELLALKKKLSKNFRPNFQLIMSCNRLLYLLILRETIESQSIPSAAELLGNWKRKKSKTIKQLMNMPLFQQLGEQITHLKAKDYIHPKFLHLISILKKTDLEKSKVLIFTNLRVTCNILSQALTDLGFHTKSFVGQRGSTSKKALREKEKILSDFRKNVFPILVATSVLEEGLDVDECNLVIFYDATKSAIRQIQRKGRTGRKKRGKVIVLTTHHTSDSVAHYISRAKEKRMKQLLEDTTWLNKKLKGNREGKESKRTIDDSQSPDFKMVKEETQFNEKEGKQNTASDLSKKERPINQEKIDNEQKMTEEGLTGILKGLQESTNLYHELNNKIVNEKQKEENNPLIEKKQKDNQTIELIIDSRERNNEILFYLKGEGIQLQFQNLDTADYIISDRIAVEYKKEGDFMSSLIDGRLFEQLKLLQNAYTSPLLILEGNLKTGLHPEALAGALATIAVDFGIPIIHSPTSLDTAILLKRLAIREQRERKRAPSIRRAFLANNPKDEAIRVLCAFSGINRTISSRLLDVFGSLKQIFSATQEELQEVDGIGKAKSKTIVDLLNKVFK
jgi:Fanconi anemia group M protein